MKKNLLLLAGLLLSLALQAQTLVKNQIVTKGIRYKKYTMTGPNQEIHVLQVDLSDPTVKLQTVKSGNVLGGGLQTVKQLAASKDSNSRYHNVVGAVNGDFFNTSAPNNTQNVSVIDGEVLQSKFLAKPRSVFGISESNNPFIDTTAENYRVIRNGVYRKIDKINDSRGTNQLILYNQFMGATTGTNQHGTELRLQLQPGYSWKVNGQVQCKVVEKRQLQVGMPVPDGQAVLSGNGSSRVYLDSIAVGAILTLDLRVAPGVSNINQVSGGYPRLVRNGVQTVTQSITAEGGTQDHDTTPDNPHTGVGISQDGNTLYMVVVDGRNPALRHGMTLTQFANFFVFLGAYNAVNFDGGWSSTLVANNVVKNIPAHQTTPGTERPVSSALLVWSTALLMDDFEAGEGHFNQSPTYDSQYTVGISASSTMDRVVTSNAYSGDACERAVLKDNTSSSSAWTVRLLSGRGLPAENYLIESTGTVGVWLKTSTAQPGAKIQLWFDDSDGAEQTPGITIINDGQWHQYNFDLNYTSGGTAITGNGLLTAAKITLDAIVLKQPNPPSGAPDWVVDFDEVAHNKAGSGTGAMMMMSAIGDTEEQKSPVMISAGTEQDPVLYSNPNGGKFVIDFKGVEVNGFLLEVANFELGKVLYRTRLMTDKQEIDAGDLPEGLYSVNVSGPGYMKRIKMLVKK